MPHRTITLHGHDISFREDGQDGPPVLLIHGMAGCSATWKPVLPALAERARVIAPDLVGHGRSAKPRTDYSIGAFASSLRDLVVALGHEQVTVVGHSLGGGIAMQFAYQFPELTGRLVLVASGGLGPEVNPILRLCAMPGSELWLPLVVNERVRRVFAGALERLPFSSPKHLDEIARSYVSLIEAPTRTAFVHTLRNGVDIFGQRIDATDRLPLAEWIPTLIVWGAKDRIIPLHHGTKAHDLLPSSRLEVFADAGHYPHVHDPERFARILCDFIESSEPANLRAQDLREVILGADQTALGS